MLISLKVAYMHEIPGPLQHGFDYLAAKLKQLGIYENTLILFTSDTTR